MSFIALLFGLALALAFYHFVLIYPIIFLARLFKRRSKPNSKIERIKTVDEFDFFKQVQIDQERGYCDIRQGKSYKTYVDEKGYRRFKDSDLLLHRWLVQKYTGRRLRGFEVVHHKDWNKLNNSLDNLEIMPWWEHNKLHGNYFSD
jgi:hypothetical protein